MLRRNRNFKAGGSSGSLSLVRRIAVGWLVPGVAVGLLGFLSITVFCPIGSLLAHAEEDTGVVTLSAIVTPSITLSMSSSVSESIEPTVDGSFKNIATVARVQVMNSEHYDVSISGNPDMAGTANPDTKIAAIAGERKASEFAANTWGYNISKNGAETTSAVVANANTVYKPVPATSTQVLGKQTTTDNAADDYYSLNFGAKVDTSIPADTYTSRVTLSVTASPVLATEYSLVYDGNRATGGTVPTRQTASSYDENYEFMVAGNTGSLAKTGYTFLGWADSADATAAQYTAGSKITVSESAPNKTIYAVWIVNTSYSVTYNGNGNTSGTAPTAQTASNANASQTFTAAAQGTLVKTGSTFQGWATSADRANAGTVDYKAGATITLTKDAPTKTLYAVWKSNVFGGVTTMQALTPALCKAATVGDTTRLTDTRDNKAYWVAKLPDSNCWMTQNMDYEISGKSTAIDTARSSDGGYFWENGLKVMNTPSASATTTIDSSWTASTDVDFYTKNGNSAVDTTNKVYDAHYLTGNYYQYSAAPTACNITNWNLPTSNQSVTTNGSFNKLASGQSTSSDSWILAKPYFFLHTGWVYGDGGAQLNFGSAGNYWSSTQYGTTRGYNLNFLSNSVAPSYSLDRYHGFSVRCYVNGN